MMKGIIWIFLISMLTVLTAKGQEGIYYYGGNWKKINSEEDARIRQDVVKRSNKKYILTTFQKVNEIWVKSRKVRIKIQNNTSQKISYNAGNFFPKKYRRVLEPIGEGLYRFEDSNRYFTLRSGTSTSSLPLSFEGSVIENYPDGRIKSKSIYKNNQLVSNENWLNDGSKYIDSVFYSVDVEPVYHMEDDFFRAFVVNNLKAAEINLEEFDDDVIIGFVLMETGQIQGTIALKGRSSELNKHLVNTIANLPGEWTPAMLDGSPVRYFMTVPFTLGHKDPSFQQVEISSNMLHYNQY